MQSHAATAVGGVLLPALARGVSSSAVAVASSKAASSPGLASMLGFGSTRIDTPMSEPLPWVPPAPVRTSPAAPPKLATGALASGATVAAIDLPGPAATLALAFEAGSAGEGPGLAGASRVLAAMAFKATANRTTFRLTRELEKVGASGFASSGRDHLLLGITALKLHAPEAVEMLLDSAMNARLSYHEFAEAVAGVQAALRAEAKQPLPALLDALHRAAYEGGLGTPALLDAAELGHLDFEALRQYYAAVVKPSRAMLAAAGVGLDAVTQLANPLLPASASAAAASAPAPSSYVGGSLNIVAPASPLSHVALALEVKGGLSDPKAVACAAVAKQLLDPARAVLPGGRESDVYASATPFACLYATTGLVGLAGAAPPGRAAALLDAVVARVEGVAKGVAEGALRQAKQLAISEYKQQLASSAGMAGLMAPRLLATGRFDPAELAAKVEGLSAGDVAGFVAAAIKRTPSVVTYGSLASAPRLGAVAKRLGA